MIVISGTITFDAAKVDATIEATNTLVAATLAEPGNVTYGFWQSSTEPGVFLVFEEWADDEALNAHMGSEHMASFMGAAGDLGISATDISRYDVSDKTRFM